MYLYIGNILIGVFIIYLGYIPIHFKNDKTNLGMDPERASSLRQSTAGKLYVISGYGTILFGLAFVVVGLLRLIGVLEPLPGF